MLSIIIPTQKGRERWLEKCLNSVWKNTENYEIIIIYEGFSWGEACKIGIERTKGDYITMLSDDMEVTPRWQIAAQNICDSGMIPAPLVLNSDNSIQSCGVWGEFLPDRTEVLSTVIPFMSRKQWKIIKEIAPIHYADAVFSRNIQEKGIKIVVCHGFKIIHHLAPENRRSHEVEERNYKNYI
jgi:GT2 family glycosyltransferase